MKDEGVYKREGLKFLILTVGVQVYGNLRRGAGGQGVRTSSLLYLAFSYPAPFFLVSPFSASSIVNYEALLLRGLPLVIFPLPARLVLPSPAPFSLASRTTPPARIFLRSHLPQQSCPFTHRTVALINLQYLQWGYRFTATYVEGLGGRGSGPLTSCTLHSRIPPLFSWFLPLALLRL